MSNLFNAQPAKLLVWAQPQELTLWQYAELFLCSLYRYQTHSWDFYATLHSAHVRTQSDFLNWLEANTENFPITNKNAIAKFCEFWQEVLEGMEYTPPPIEQIVYFPDFSLSRKKQFLKGLFALTQRKGDKVLDFIGILKDRQINTADDFCIYLWEVCLGFPVEANNPKLWIEYREIWETQLSAKVLN
jgi:hypothetical protein